MKISYGKHRLLWWSKSNRYKAGFTLLELMVVLLVIGIVAGVGGLALNNQIPKYKLRGDTRTIVSTLMLARMKATQSGVQYAVRFNMDDPQGYDLQRGNLSAGTPSDGWTNESYHRNMSAGVSMASVQDDDGTTSAGGGAARIIYNPNGSSSVGEILLGNGNLQYTISLTRATGRVVSEKVAT